MKVIAAQGLKCPMERNPRQYITDGETVEVPETSYYKRLVADGSLLIAPRAKSSPSLPFGQGLSGQGKKQKEVKTDGI